MRSEKPAELLRLARALAASAEGMTLAEMAAFSRIGRRTAERRRDAVEAVFGPLERIEDGRQVKFRMNARGLGNFAAAPTAQELAELENAARAYEAGRDPARAEILRSLGQKIRASLRHAERRRLDTDIDAQLRAEAFACQVGPRPFADAKVLGALREALLAGVMVKFLYGEGEGGPLRWRKVIPYGLLFAPRYYLTARVKSKPEPVLFRLDRIRNLELTGEPGAPPAGFNLKAYASRSFGVFQEAPEDVVLRFDPSAAADARSFLFHASQTIADEADGSLIVRFRAAGLLQIAHHLLTWGSAVTIIAPEELKSIMSQQIAELYAHYRPVRGATGRRQ
ncbi:MAG: WYL domain-containing protein [Methylocapsa sp.]|nr:WYL domain-containing protein [Methylocapsa sp.]